MMRLAAIAAIALAATHAAGQPIEVRVAGQDGVYLLLRGGEPYVVKGVGAGNIDLATVALRGGNSIRTWGVEGAQATLDAAGRHGLTVALNLPVASERFGFDYDDAAAVAAQERRIEALVRRYRDHPALLCWILGNELDFNYTNPRVYDAVNALSRLVHRLDPNHPTTTTITGVRAELLKAVRTRAADLDFLSLQLYGALAALPRYREQLLADIPFMVTEWGPLGFWEVGKTDWGAPIEQNSTEKARHYLGGYQNFILPALPRQALGSYVFLWGQKQERTPTWFSMFTETGERTATVDAMQVAWTRTVPGNQAPIVEALRLRGKPATANVTLRAGKTYPAVAVFSDPDGDDLTYAWSVKVESASRAEGGDAESAIPDLPGLIASPPGEEAEAAAPGGEVVVQAPAAPGHYRLFVTAYDGRGNAAYANLPFRVL